MHEEKFEHEPRGEFRGDFSRDTFDPFRHFSRVLMQQGRVHIDADWNEQVSIFSYYLRRLGTDLMGPHGAPCTEEGEDGEGYMIRPSKGATFNISSGNYYVKGILCENNETITYHNQPYFQKEGNIKDGSYLVYLDVWERHLSFVEDNYMREAALGGPDTASRAKIVWQVKLKELTKKVKITKGSKYNEWNKVLVKEKKPGTGLLRARARKDENDNGPCLTSPESRYRGAENQLYRVEIHKGGMVKDNVTFKWSRNNAADIYSIKKVDGTIITLEHLGRDNRSSLKPNDWVELVDDDYILQNRSDSLLQVFKVDHENMQVTLKESPKSDVGQDKNKHKHPYLRRWDHTARTGNLSEGAIIVTEGSSEDWLHLEDGVQIQFDFAKTRMYHTGDYWLIPARTATGDVEWPGSVETPIFLAPHGVVHHYAPLQLITVTDGKLTIKDENDLRRKLKKMW